jgi:hypothetical protein
MSPGQFIGAIILVSLIMGTIGWLFIRNGFMDD